jgi:anti-sigma factor RsiW
MKCKEIRESIISDYLDGELRPPTKEMIEAHLAQCKECREFAQVAKATETAFREAEPAALDEERIWRQISERIGEQKQTSMIYEPQRHSLTLADRLRLAFKRSFVVTTVVTAVIVAFVFFSVHDRSREYAYNEEDIQLIENTLDELTIASLDEDGFSTEIEEYFL